MEILIDAGLGADGRLSGTVRLPGCTERIPFSGTLELQARLEELCREDAATNRRTQ